MIILITGSNGFIGRNLVSHLQTRADVKLLTYDLGTSDAVLDQALREADVIFHLAGVNRPQKVEEFQQGNADFTTYICNRILQLRLPTSDGASVVSPAPPTPVSLRPPLLILASSIQAELDNPYGLSKREAEKAVAAYVQECVRHQPQAPPASAVSSVVSSTLPITDHRSPISDVSSPISALQPSSVSALFGIIYRLPNVFGKGCRPNYNSAVATFCHNIARDLEIKVNDPNAEMKLVYIDDVLEEFIRAMDGHPTRTDLFGEVPVVHQVKLGQIVEWLHSFKQSRLNLQISNQADGLVKKLYATYLSYLPEDKFSYPLKMNVDARGSFTEFIRTPDRGQVSVNISKPGITKGNHWHHTKNEKFLVVSGRGVIRFRQLGTAEILEYVVSGEKLEVVDIPPGYTHNIENLGATDMVTIMWVNEPFDPAKPDTYLLKV